MKILIADDHPRRYERLIGRLGELGVERKDITLAPSANDARASMENTSFDLLLLDVLLPKWPEGDASPANSLDLLLELHEGEGLQRPRRILGITGDVQLVESAREEFASWTWSIVQYSESNEEWSSRVLQCAKYILKELAKPEASPRFGVDLAVVCALPSPELDEVLRLPWHWSSPRPLDDVTFVHDGFLEVEGRKITVAATAAPRMGMVATALRSSAVINLLRPRLLAMCGICAGVEKKVNLGDVILADPAWDFQSGKRVRDKGNSQFSMAPHQLYASTSVRSHLEQIRSDQTALAQIALDYGIDASGLTRLVIGPMASGSAVLADGGVIKEIKDQHRELVGVEMEAYGLYAAAHSTSMPQPQAFVLKGVCDFADPDKDDKHQRYAAYASARVLGLLMSRFGAHLLN
jgi:nucleoside phosphorylase